MFQLILHELHVRSQGQEKRGRDTDIAQYQEGRGAMHTLRLRVLQKAQQEKEADALRQDQRPDLRLGPLAEDI